MCLLTFQYFENLETYLLFFYCWLRISLKTKNKGFHLTEYVVDLWALLRINFVIDELDHSLSEIFYLGRLEVIFVKIYPIW